MSTDSAKTTLGAQLSAAELALERGKGARMLPVRRARDALEQDVMTALWAHPEPVIARRAAHDRRPRPRRSTWEDATTSSRSARPRVAVTLGDPAGIGLVARLLADRTARVTSIADGITRESVLGAGRLLHTVPRDSGIAAPRIGVCALNPHAGESGRSRRHEIDIVAPAVAELRADGLDAAGPFSRTRSSCGGTSSTESSPCATTRARSR